MTDTTALLARLHPLLQERRETLAGQWWQALAATGFVARDGAEMQQRLLALTDQVSATLRAEHFDPDAARRLGAALADLGYRDATALDRTLETLGGALLVGFPDAWCVALQPRLVRLLGQFAAGFTLRPGA